jgi:hypothetical protein
MDLILEQRKTTLEIRKEPPIVAGGYWSLTERQLEIFSRNCMGANFIEPGCGNGTLAKLAMESGAKSGIGFDKESQSFPKHKNLRFNVSYASAFVNDYKGDYDTVILSYPLDNTSYSKQVMPLIVKAKKIIYLGDNFDGFVCGDRGLWEKLKSLSVSEYAESHRNTIIVYENKPRNDNLLLWEEEAGIDKSKIYNRPTSPEKFNR